MQNLLNEALKVSDEAEVISRELQEIPVKFEDYKLQEIESKNTKDIALRILKDKKVGRTLRNNLQDKSGMVRSALDIAQFSSPENYHFINERPGSVLTFSERINKLSLNEMMDTGRNILDRIKRKAGSISADTSVVKKITKQSYINSAGFKGEYAQTHYLLAVILKLTEGAGSHYEYKLRGDYFEIDDELIDRLIFEYNLTNNLKNISTGKYPVVFSSRALWTLLYRFILGISGDNLIKELSPLKDKLNKPVFSPKITIKEEPHLNFISCSCPFDDEGVPTSPKVIIENGILKSYIYDLKSASKLNAKPAGNGFRVGMFESGLDMAPTPSTTNLVILPGERSLDEVTSSIDHGIYVKSLLGFHSGNLTQGEFSMNVGMGFLIEKGKLTGRVQDCMISGNIYDCFKNIQEITSSQEEVNMGILPDIVFSDMSVVGKE